MSETQHDEDARRDAALAAWVSRPAAAPEDELLVPPRRPAIPPSFFVILAASCAWFAAEPTSDLRYELFGPGQAIDLGRPGAYAFDQARDGSRVRLSGYAGSIRGRPSREGEDHEFVALVGVPVLVYRTRRPAVAPDAVEAFEGEGRLIQLESTPATWLDRMIRPAARYTTVRLEFEAYNQLPSSGAAWLLLEGDIPRAHPWAIAEPALLWALVALFVFLARRSYVLGVAARAAMRRI